MVLPYGNGIVYGTDYGIVGMKTRRAFFYMVAFFVFLFLSAPCVVVDCAMT